MNGPQDMGGLQGYGPVVAEPDEPYFHADWEKRALGMVLAMAKAGGWNLDMVRHARETIPPAAYLAMSYYAIWVTGLTRLLAARGLVAEDEIVAGHSLRAAQPGRPVLRAADVAPALARGNPMNRTVGQPARFAVGDRIRARNMHPAGHTRLPRYVRGHVGTITHQHGAHVFPDSNAEGIGENPQWLYTVRFDGRELWGEGADPTVSVSVDAWEPYLSPA